MGSPKKSGSAAIATLISLSILLCLGGVLARLVKTESDSTINFRDGIAAQCIAEAGLRRAIVVLYSNGNPHGLTEIVKRDYFEGSYQITTDNEGTSLRVRSTGKVGSAMRSASVLVLVAMETTSGELLADFTIISWGI